MVRRTALGAGFPSRLQGPLQFRCVAALEVQQVLRLLDPGMISLNALARPQRQRSRSCWVHHMATVFMDQVCATDRDRPYTDKRIPDRVFGEVPNCHTLHARSCGGAHETADEGMPNDLTGASCLPRLDLLMVDEGIPRPWRPRIRRGRLGHPTGASGMRKRGRAFSGALETSRPHLLANGTRIFMARTPT